MVYDDQDWAIFGSISSESTHIALRVALKAEIPIVNSASTDPTIPETYIPWYFTDLQDDRVQGLTLARHIYTDLGLKRVALLRVNSRYGRFGVLKFRDASRRLGHPVVIEQKFMPGDTDFTRALKIIQSSRADAVVFWADEIPAANILKQMKALGMKQRALVLTARSGRKCWLRPAPRRRDSRRCSRTTRPATTRSGWISMLAYDARFHEKPEQFASLAYDAMNALLDSICKAGLNRARIHDALADIQEYDGVTGHMIFDPNQKNVAHMYLGTVHDGAVSYKTATMAPEVRPTPLARMEGVSSPGQSNAPYARVGEDGVTYAGPHLQNLPDGARKVVLFGPHAGLVAQSAEMQALLNRDPGQGARWTLLPVASDQSWGAASTQLVKALMDEHALVILALDRDAAHLSEQLALKAFVPVVALSEDRKLTSTNVPWIFRLPAATKPAAALMLIEEAAEKSGPNAEKLRDVLASGERIDGVAFLSTGEPRVE